MFRKYAAPGIAAALMGVGLWSIGACHMPTASVPPRQVTVKVGDSSMPPITTCTADHMSCTVGYNGTTYLVYDVERTATDPQDNGVTAVQTGAVPTSPMKCSDVCIWDIQITPSTGWDIVCVPNDGSLQCVDELLTADPHSGS